MDDDYLSIDDAAAALRVSRPTISRWIARGILPAYRLGRRRVFVRRRDLRLAMRPLHAQPLAAAERPSPHMTREQRQRALGAVRKALQLQVALLREHGGPFDDSVQILREERAARSRKLAERQ